MIFGDFAWTLRLWNQYMCSSQPRVLEKDNGEKTMKKNVEKKSKSRVTEIQVLATDKLRQVTGGTEGKGPIMCW